MGPLGAVLDLLAPPLCWGCGSSARRGEPLCLDCRGQLRWMAAEPVRLGGVEAWAPVAYDGPARALVAGLKFRGAAGLAEPLAAQIAAAAPGALLRPPAALVPAPTSQPRARRRGYDQAALLAAALGRRTGLRVEPCLRRRRSSEGFYGLWPARSRNRLGSAGRGGGGGAQVGRGRAERLLALDGAFEAVAGARVPARAVLVDDVVTTGGTISACADALHRAGAVEVAAVAYALTPGR